MSKAITWIVVAAIVIGGVWYFWGRGSSPSSTPSQQGSAQQSTTSTDTSDAALQQDTASVDAQLQAASAEASTAGSFKDTPVQQTE